MEEKLAASIERQRLLLELVSGMGVGVHVTFVSPDSARVAFGLGIPVVTMSDTPHSEAVSRLAVPLARSHLAPSFLLGGFSAFGGLTELVGFDGVFEAAWVRRFRPSLEPVEALGLEPYGYVFLRPPESKAYYYRGFGGAAEEAVYRVARHALERGLRVLVYPRYVEQKARYRGLGGVVFLEEATDTLSLEYYARLVVTGGATMATESALLGTPSMYLFPRELEVPRYVAGRGFPVFHAPPGRELEVAERLLGMETDRGEYLRRAREVFEDPVPRILALVKNLSS